ncbi:carbohydrate ABC transporter permease [Deinococcus sp.]|uniref:carbohydrate ABC transporter permease n=1 Tax=Deinococcus sp. TaxID=47478 RepID=UPI003C7BEC2D
MTQKTSALPRPARQRRPLGEEGLALLMLLPAALIFAGVLLYPMLNTLYNSLFVNSLTEPYLGTPFVGLRHYADMLHDARFLNALRNTLVYGLITVSGSFLVGVPMALVAHADSRLKWLARVAMLLPWAMPPVFSALIFQWLFNGQYGLINDLLVRLHLVARPVAFLTSPLLAGLALVVTVIWKTSSFVALIALGGLQGIPQELTEAAEVDGANRVQGFFRVTLPLLAPALAVAFIFRAISALQVFDLPYALTGGGPVALQYGATETLGIYIYRTTLEFLDFGYGAALSVALFAVSLAITALYIRFIRGAE